MPCWYWEPEDVLKTPSFRDGIDAETEAKYRSDGAKFIQKCGQDLRLTHNSIATGIVFFHRFYMFYSFKKYHKFLAAATALFLAGKVEETPKMCRDLVRSVQKHLDERLFAQQFGSNRAPIDEIMQLERLMLRTLKFDFLVEHPYKHLLEMGKRLRGQQEAINTIVQHAWAFINDSLYTNLCLQWEPEIIACSVLYLGSLCSNCQIKDWDTRKTDEDKWWEHFVPGLDFPLIEHICHRILDLYQSSSGATKATGADVKRISKPGTDIVQQKQSSNSLPVQQQTQPQPQTQILQQQLPQQQPQLQPQQQQQQQQQQVIPQPTMQQQQQHLQQTSISAAAVAAHEAMNQVHIQMSQAMPMLTNSWPGYTGVPHSTGITLPTPPPPPPPPLPLINMQSHHQHLPTPMQPPPPPPPPLIGCVDTQQQQQQQQQQPIGVFQPALPPVIGQHRQQQQPPIGQIGTHYQRPQQTNRTPQHPNKNLHALT